MGVAQSVAFSHHLTMSNSLSGPATFADDGSAVISRQIGVQESQLVADAQNKISLCSEVYEIDRTVSIITERGYKRVSMGGPGSDPLDTTTRLA
jgi:diphthamide biosynthesis protein 2